MPEADPNQTRAETIEQPAVFRISVAFRSQAAGAGLEYRVLTPQEASPTCAAWADFEGVYCQVRSGWAAGDQSRGTLWMQNANGVYLRWSVYAAGYH